MVVESGVCKHLAVDEGTDTLDATSAESLVEYLTPKPVVQLKAEDLLAPNSKVVAAYTAVAIAFIILMGNVDPSSVVQTSADLSTTADISSLEASM